MVLEYQITELMLDILKSYEEFNAAQLSCRQAGRPHAEKLIFLQDLFIRDHMLKRKKKNFFYDELYKKQFGVKQQHDFHFPEVHINIFVILGNGACNLFANSKGSWFDLCINI